MTSALRHVDERVCPLIDGALQSSESDAAIDVTNPSNGRPLLSIPAGAEADVNRAVASARRALERGHWTDAPPSFKKDVLSRVAQLVDDNATELDALDGAEMGKPISVALFSAKEAAKLLRYYAEAVDKVSGEVYTSDSCSFVAQRLVPRGVVAAIVPWNFPTFNAVLKVGPALAAGNCVILKPSELASRSAVRLARLAMQAGLPPGTLNVVPGLGKTVGQALALHSEIDMVAFTGSTEVGKLMLQYAGRSNLKVVIAECGGKSPQIVFDDGVDFDAASDSIARFLLTNQGQICSVGSRLLVQRSIERKLLDGVVARMSSIVMGDALNPETTFGPIASLKQHDRVMDYIKTAQDEGAELVSGGRRALEDLGGYFIEPTVFRNVQPSARIAQEEVFGPILAVIPFDDEAQAVQIANSTPYGLAAYVWTANLSRGMRMAKGIRSCVVINAAAPRGEGAGHAASWEPAGHSGIGCEGGLVGLQSYLRRQTIWFNHT